MKINSLKPKSGQHIQLGKISILVGANNVGKSQTLKDIQQRMELGLISKPVVIDEINFDPPTSFEEIFSGLTIKNSNYNLGNKIVYGIKTNLRIPDSFEFNYDAYKSQFDQNGNFDFAMGNISKFRVSDLDASSRLQLASSTPSFNPDTDNPQNIIQHLFIDHENETRLKQAFQQAFSMDIMLDYSGLTEMCLRVAKNLPEIPEDPRKAYVITKEFCKIDDQGDGFRSFVGIILGILVSKDRIILLDEPEAFLHPAQARFLGKWISDNSDLLQGQLIIATHNSNFLSGILSSDKKVDIYRLNRRNNETVYNLIPSEATEKLIKSPMLSSQRILESIFHRGVVVCEADADRIIYQTVSKKTHSNQEVLFVHSHNKQTLKDVAQLLIEAKIPVVVVADIDILNDENDLEALLKTYAANEDFVEILAKRNRIAKSINKENDNEILMQLVESLNALIYQLEKCEHTLDGARGALNRIRRDVTKWKLPKTVGVNGFPKEIIKDVIELLEELKSFGIFVVPVGELEGWLDVGTMQKNKWIIKALEVLYTGDIPEPLLNFVDEICRTVELKATQNI